MMYYVVKHTQEEGGNTQVIRAHSDKVSAVKDYHREIAETLEYIDVLDVLGVVLMDEYNNVVEGCKYRYEKPVDPVDPIVP